MATSRAPAGGCASLAAGGRGAAGARRGPVTCDSLVAARGRGELAVIGGWRTPWRRAGGDQQTASGRGGSSGTSVASLFRVQR